MNKRLMIAIFSLGLIVSTVSSGALGEGPENDNILDLHYNILIGELFPSGNVYLERFSLSGGFDNEQHFEGLNYAEEIVIYPIKKAKWASVKASFSRLIKATYIGETEKNSKYFNLSSFKALHDYMWRKFGRPTTEFVIRI